MGLNEKQYMAAKIAELRSISKDVREIKLMVQDILEIFKMNTYGESDIGVQVTIDDICKKIVEEAQCKEMTASDRIGYIMKEAFDE